MPKHVFLLLSRRDAYRDASPERLASLCEKAALGDPGWFKFGGVEFFKINITKKVGEETAWNNRQKIYLLSSAMAEFIAKTPRSRRESGPFFGPPFRRE